VSTLESLQELIEVFLKLSRGEVQEFELAAFSNVRLTNLSSVVLRTDEKAESVRLDVEQDGTRVDWTCSPEDWDLGAAMLRALEAHPKGHQYLPPDQGGDEPEIDLDYWGPAGREFDL
jgi:hypothetical protein